MPSSTSTHDSHPDAVGLPTVGNGLAPLPPGYELFEQEEQAFHEAEAEHQDAGDDRFRRWGREMRRGAAFCIVRLRAYGEQRVRQLEVNQGEREGTAMPILAWDNRNGWSKGHAASAVKVYKAWRKHGDSYPLSGTGLTVREVPYGPHKPRFVASSEPRHVWLSPTSIVPASLASSA